MTYPHERLITILLSTPAEARATWPDYWRGFFSAYALGRLGGKAMFHDALVDSKEWQNGYHFGDLAWKREHAARGPKHLKKPKGN